MSRTGLRSERIMAITNVTVVSKVQFVLTKKKIIKIFKLKILSSINRLQNCNMKFWSPLSMSHTMWGVEVNHVLAV
jgi:hypothetical protein